MCLMQQETYLTASAPAPSSSDPLLALDPLVYVFQLSHYLLINIKFISISIALAWLVIEIFFFVHMKFTVLKKLCPLRPPLPPLSCQRKLIFRTIDLLEKLKGVYSVEEFISGFFFGAKVDELRQDNLKSFLAWAMFGRHLQDITDEQLHDVDICVEEFAQRHGVILKPGLNSAVRHIDMTLVDFPYWHRPLAMYVGAAVVEMIGNFIYRGCGFVRLEMKGVTYWFRSGAAGSGPPCLFFHGVCMGWLSYFQLIRNLGQSKTMLLVDLDAIKILSLSFDMRPSEQYCAAVKKILTRHNIGKVGVIGHSFGTITAGWFCKHCPDSVAHITLLDPVCLLLGLPSVAYSFLYRFPSTFVQWGIFLFATTDPTLSHTLYRNFWWYRNVLWLEDIPRNTPVVIGVAGCDEVNHAAALVYYAKEHTGRDKLSAPIDVAYWPEFSHAQILLSSEQQKALADIIKRSEMSI
jgi:pimeloyl-ACP methyl ester carboxylesterase